MAKTIKLVAWNTGDSDGSIGLAGASVTCRGAGRRRNTHHPPDDDDEVVSQSVSAHPSRLKAACRAPAHPARWPRSHVRAAARMQRASTSIDANGGRTAPAEKRELRVVYVYWILKTIFHKTRFTL